MYIKISGPVKLDKQVFPLEDNFNNLKILILI